MTINNQRQKTLTADQLDAQQQCAQSIPTSHLTDRLTRSRPFYADKPVLNDNTCVKFKTGNLGTNVRANGFKNLERVMTI